MSTIIKFLFFISLLPAFCSGQSINNLDIKNGFLQFRLGDSLSDYKMMITVDQEHEGYYKVKSKYNKLSNHTDGIYLKFKNEILSVIEVIVIREHYQQFLNDALKNAYGPGKWYILRILFREGT